MAEVDVNKIKELDNDLTEEFKIAANDYDKELAKVEKKNIRYNREDSAFRKVFKNNRELFIAIIFFLFGVLFTIYFLYIIISFLSIIGTAIFMKCYYTKKYGHKKNTSL